MAEYDNIADKYSETISLMRKYAIDPSFFKLLRNVKGKTVLDLACGSGYFSRKIKKLGASKVVGIDISKKMIEFAIKEEKKNPLGIKYVCQNVSKMPKIGEFDIVVGSYLLHYSKTRKELKAMIENVTKNLKPNGRFIALNNNPENPLRSIDKYSVTITGNEPLKEGDKLTVTFYKDGKFSCSFTNYLWFKSTYEKLLKKAGLSKIKWNQCHVSEEGIKKFGEEFWEDLKKHPSTIIIEAIKK